MLKEVRSTVVLGQRLHNTYRSREKTQSGFLTGSCAAALEYILALEGVGTLSNNDRRGLFHFLELGKFVNNFYDERQLPFNYREKRSSLKEPGHLDSSAYKKHFLRVVKNLERNRPNPWSGVVSHADIAEYRGQTNLVYLAAACTSAGVGKITDFIDTSENTPKIHEKTPEWFRGLHSGLIALQVIDDMIGWRGDMSFKRPSFFTYLCPKEYIDTPPQMVPQEVVRAIFKEMNAIFDNYRNLMHRQLPNDYALAMAINMLRFVPTIGRTPIMLGLQKLTGVELINAKHVNE